MNKLSYVLTQGTSGFCNRAHSWAIAAELAQINNMKVVQNWEGEHYYLDLPNTLHLSEISKDVAWNLINTNSLSTPYKFPNSTESYKLVCGYDYNRNIGIEKPLLYQYWFNQIKLKHPVISEIIKLTQDRHIVGVHIRRNDFFKPTQTDTDFKSNTTQIHESWFLSVMKDLQKTNKNITFYIASENPKDFSHFSENFEVIDRSFFNLQEIPRTNPHYVISLFDLIDLFVLKHCNCIIETPRSSFSHFATLINSNPSISSNTYKGYFYHKRNHY